MGSVTDAQAVNNAITGGMMYISFDAMKFRMLHSFCLLIRGLRFPGKFHFAKQQYSLQ